jgi:hypothetical protein
MLCGLPEQSQQRHHDAVVIKTTCYYVGVLTCWCCLRTHNLPSCCAQLLLLENVRFYKEEEKNDAEFAKKVRATSWSEPAHRQPC